MIGTLIAAAALLISFCSLIVSIHFMERSFRPIVTLSVKTHSAGSELIAYDLVVLNSGSLPAKNIRILAIENSLIPALGKASSESNKKLWLSCFGKTIFLLQNNDKISCSFGTTKRDDTGFWKYGAIILTTITYEGWFGRKYKDRQEIRIIDSESFTGSHWGKSP